MKEYYFVVLIVLMAPAAMFSQSNQLTGFVERNQKRKH